MCKSRGGQDGPDPHPLKNSNLLNSHNKAKDRPLTPPRQTELSLNSPHPTP